MYRFRSTATLILAALLSAASAFAQAVTTPAGTPGYANAGPVDIRYFGNMTLNPVQPGLVLNMPPGSDTDPNAVFLNPTYGLSQVSRGFQGVSGGSITPVSPPATFAGITSVPTFNGAFVAQAGPSTDKDFFWTMIGNDPLVGGTTTLKANIVEVSLQLLNSDGSVFKNVPFAPFEQATLASPNFANSTYDSSPAPTQFQDAVQRAEFFNTMKSDWHTLLSANVVDKVTIQVPFFVNVRLQNGNVIQARSYFTGTAADGNTFTLMLSPLFNLFFDNAVVNEINLGNLTTGALNMTLWPNTYLFNLNQNNPNVPGGCCTLGFHNFFGNFDGNFPQLRFVAEYASWISPGIFGGGFQDVTALSHETGEAFDNPFLSNATPNWQFPGEPPTAKVCQANLETGDPIEVLANAATAIKLPVGWKLTTFHPQNLALLQWFFMGATSNAVDGAFSYPDETVLTHSALPCPQ